MYLTWTMIFFSNYYQVVVLPKELPFHNVNFVLKRLPHCRTSRDAIMVLFECDSMLI